MPHVLRMDMAMGPVRMSDEPKPKLGSGERLKQLKAKLSRIPGIQSPGGLAGWIGRKKYGAAKMAKMSVTGRKRK